MAKVDPKELETEIINMIAKIAEIEPSKIIPDANLVEDLGMDSMNALEILATVEKKYGLKIPESEVSKMTSLSKIVQIASEYLNNQAC